VEKNETPLKWQNKKILLMQGAGINAGRGGIELLEAMKFLSGNYLLVFIGGGTQWNEIVNKRKEWQLEEKVEMIGKLPPSELKKFTAHAYIGFSLDSFDDLNCLYNLPNKIFDYIHAQVPVIATAIPEVSNIIEQYECGVCLKSYEPKVIAKAVEEIAGNEITYNKLKQNCIAAARELCWEEEEQKLIAVYQPFL
ncbi:MAG: glycosyltransferase, partial [Ginsengibacter sp.]